MLVALATHLRKFARLYTTSPLRYDIPEKYRNAFFLANAPLFDYTNWFIHRSYEVCFADLVDRLRRNRPGLGSAQAAAKKVVNIINYLEPCNSLIDIRFPVRKSDGLYEVVRGFRAYHALHLDDDAPCLGGMRICADLNRDHVKALSVLSTFKHACMDIPMTGAHGGLKISGPDYKSDDLKAIIKTYGRELTKRKTNVDVLEPDLYCGSEEMAWISEEFAKGVEGKGATACAVGKPGGLKDYDGLLAMGAVFALKCFLDNQEIMKEIKLEGGLADLKYIVQGLGKTGGQVAALLSEAGATCVGVKEHDAFIYMPQGIPVLDLLEYKKKTGSILEFNTKVKPSSANQIFANECDLLILAATHRSLQCHVAERIAAKIVVEVAHAAITPTAHKILVGRKRLVLPDIFASAGVSVASYLECMGNLPSNVLPTKEDSQSGDVKTRVEGVMKRSYEDMVEILDKFKLGVDVRTAAYIKGITKIFQKIYDKKICP